ncbi:MAG: hypothetical protein P9L90_06560 [Candidatus Aadella gelida]|nr:hypothetical protein [Candidatus Aadella gelida]
MPELVGTSYRNCWGQDAGIGGDECPEYALLTGIIFLLVLGFNGAICLYHNRHHYPVVFNLETEEEYLSKWVTNYPMAKYVNQNLPIGAKILGVGIYKPYYFKRWVVRDGVLDIWEGYRSKYTTEKSMQAYLKSQDFSYVIYKEINGKKPDDSINRIIGGKEAIFSYGPVQNIEKPQKEIFFLYKL